MADFRFQPGDLGIGRVHLALCVVQCIASGKMRFPGFLGARLGFPQRGALRLKVGRRPLDFQRQALALAFGFAFAQQPQQLLALGQLLVQGMVAAGHLGLRFEALDLVTEFFPNVLDAQEVLAGIFETPLRLLAPFLVAGDAGRLFEEHAQVVRLGLDDARNHALANDGVRTRAEAGAEEQIGDVLAADLQVVDEVVRLALPGQHALDRQFGVLRPLAECPAEQVLEDQLDGSTRYRLAVR